MFVPDASDVRTAEKVIDDSGLVTVLEARVAALHVRSGRPRELSIRALLVGAFLVAQHGTMHIRRVAPLMNQLPTATKRRLGIDRPGGVTTRQVQRLFTTITHALRTDGIDALDQVFDLLCDATQPDEADATTSIALDSTDVESWGRRRSVKSKKKVSDPDARWRGTQNAKAIWKNPLFGYDLTVAVTIPEIAGADVPLVARRARLRPAAQDVVPTGQDTIAAVAAMQGALGDVVADRAYSARNDGTDFALPVRALGGEPVFALTKYQVGVSGTAHGAVMIDGAPFSPSTPEGLWSITPPLPGSDIASIIRYQQTVAMRAQYALVPHGKRNHNGDQDYRCPAAAGKLRCPLVPKSLAAPYSVTTVLKPPLSVLPGTVCSQATKRFQATEVPLAQRDLYGTRAWYDSFNRRNRVEGFFGNIKDEARESLRRGIIRVRTKEKIGLWLALAVAAANVRLTQAFRDRASGGKTRPKKVRTGRPRKPGLSSYVPDDFERHMLAASSPPRAG